MHTSIHANTLTRRYQTARCFQNFRGLDELPSHMVGTHMGLTLDPYISMRVMAVQRLRAVLAVGCLGAGIFASARKE
jgi:hypothetical protein